MLDVRSEIARVIGQELAQMQAGDVPVALERSARPEFGDWSSPAPLKLARVLRRAPLQIATELCRRLEQRGLPYARQWTATAPGYVNVLLRDSVWAEAVIENALSLHSAKPIIVAAAPQPAGKTLVEHTATNPNKAAHVGHLRNACVGDTVVRILRRLGQDVEVNNYIDDTGVQVADVAVGIRDLEIRQHDGEPFDVYCSRVYVQVSQRYETEPDLRQKRQDVLREVEAGNNDTARLVKDIASRVVDCHLQTMERFGIGYDLLTWESDILALGFWDQAFAILRDSGAIYLETAGKQAGCWVMRLDEDETDKDDDAKVLVKSDGIATYTAKDIAYQMWKFGLLNRDFHYRYWRDNRDNPASTSATPGELDGADFGKAQRVVNVIDARQAYPQQVVKLALQRQGHEDAAANSVHLAYEVVALSPAAAAELGIAVDEGRSMYALSGRQGIEVRADELLSRAVAHIAQKTPDSALAARIAAGAVRYYLLRFSLPQIIVFDFEEALRTTGDTGVYLQYAHARAAGILRKVAPPEGALDCSHEFHPSERQLLHQIDGYGHVLAEAARELSPVTVATYAFELASALSDFYEHTPAIVRETDASIRNFRRTLVLAARQTLADVLTVLGMPAPDRI